jgi:TfoX/Sxy family transcriptional regulator of competence genes
MFMPKGMTMATGYDALANRVRTLLAEDGITEQKMFGGVCFMLDGNMVAGASPRGLLLRLPKDEDPAALARRGARPMEHGGRTMTGFVYIEPATIESEEGLQSWLDTATRYVRTLPPKVKTAKAPARRKR